MRENEARKVSKNYLLERSEALSADVIQTKTISLGESLKAARSVKATVNDLILTA